MDRDLGYSLSYLYTTCEAKGDIIDSVLRQLHTANRSDHIHIHELG